MPDPLVSVVLTTYNRPTLTVAALESALAQTLEDVEIIVVDDGSTDDTAERLRPYEGRIRLIRQENQGVGAAKNTGIEAARGVYLAFLDSDDWWHPKKLAVQVDFMEKHPACVGCVVPWAVAQGPDAIAGVTPPFDKAAICDAASFIRRPARILYRHLFWTPSAMLVRRAALHPTDRFGLGAANDHTFNLHLFARGPVAVAGDRVLAFYRAHAANISKTRPDNHLRGLCDLRRLDWPARLADAPPGYLDDLRAFLADRARSTLVRMLMHGDRARALRLFLQEAPHLLRNGLALFVLAFPVFWMLPPAAARRYWRGEHGAQETGPAPARAGSPSARRSATAA